MWLLSLGPAPTLMGQPLMYRGPYALLMYLPGFNSLRVPARFWMTVTLCLAVIGAMVFARLTEKLGRMRLAAAAIVAFGVLADTWMAAMPLAATPKPFPALELRKIGTRPDCRAAARAKPIRTSQRCTGRCRTTVRSSTATADIFRRTMRRFASG